MAIGALQAVMAANPARLAAGSWVKAAASSSSCGRKLWRRTLNFETIAVANHPGVSPTGLRIAVNMLQGKAG